MLSVGIEFDLSGITNHLNKIQEVLENNLDEAVQAGSQVFYDQMRLNARAADSKGTGSGLLVKSIYQYRDKTDQRPGHSAYKISWRKGMGPKGQDGKRMLSGLPVAYHGILIEYGYLQRYESYINKAGQWKTLVRPEKRGTPPPKGGQAARDAYYVLRKTPIQHAPRSFLRKTYFEKKDEALKAVEMKLQDMIARKLI